MEAPRYYSRLGHTQATRANLPHWSQACACFVTFRLADSLPESLLAPLRESKTVWVAQHPQPWNDQEQTEYNALFGEQVQDWLDQGYGACVLKETEIRQIVESTLKHFDGVRYSLYAYVVMPNHVHVLFMPTEGYDVAGILKSWKSYSARMINQHLGKSGPLWQKESWDRLVRSVEQFDAYRAYIRKNSPALAFDAYR